MAHAYYYKICFYFILFLSSCLFVDDEIMEIIRKIVAILLFVFWHFDQNISSIMNAIGGYYS
jgi:hypothetical protein